LNTVAGVGTHTVTTRKSWFNRMGGALAGVLVGLLLIPLSVGLLFWNEGRAVKTARSLAEGAEAVESVTSDSVDPTNQGKLVHVTGRLEIDTDLSDPVFGVTAQAVKLERKVEMFQWQEQSRRETRDRIGGGQETITTYTYNTGWSDRPIDSSRFAEPTAERQNPPMRFESETQVADRATLGAFALGRDLLARLSGSQSWPVTSEAEESIKQAAGPTAQVNAGQIYIGQNPGAPAVGDLRIAFEVVRPTDVSVVGAQSGSTFQSYPTGAGRPILMISEGTQTADEMFAAAQATNRAVTWLLRALGLVAMFIALGMLFAPASVLVSVIPFLGRIVRFGTGLVAGLLTVLIGSVTIAIAWLFYRPLFGALVLLVGGGIAFGLVQLARKRGAAPETETEPVPVA
jgi:hypothetical protein